MLTIQSPAQMRDLGLRLAIHLKVGDLLILTGPLGAGKTALTKAIGEGLGIADITSPTFVIAKEYQGRLPLIHVDAYRLITSDQSRFEFDDLDIDTRRESAVTVIEWGSALGIRPEEQYLEIKIGFGEGEEERTVALQGHGQRWADFAL